MKQTKKVAIRLGKAKNWGSLGFSVKVSEHQTTQTSLWYFLCSFIGFIGLARLHPLRTAALLMKDLRSNSIISPHLGYTCLSPLSTLYHVNIVIVRPQNCIIDRRARTDHCAMHFLPGKVSSFLFDENHNKWIVDRCYLSITTILHSFNNFILILKITYLYPFV